MIVQLLLLYYTRDNNNNYNTLRRDPFTDNGQGSGGPCPQIADKCHTKKTTSSELKFKNPNGSNSNRIPSL